MHIFFMLPYATKSGVYALKRGTNMLFLVKITANRLPKQAMKRILNETETRSDGDPIEKILKVASFVCQSLFKHALNFH